MGAFKIAVLPGDYIGPEIIAEGVRALEAVGRRFGHEWFIYGGFIGEFFARRRLRGTCL